MAREVGQVRRPASLSASNVRSSRSACGLGEPAFAPQQVVRAGEALPLAGVGLEAVADDTGLVIAVEPALQG